ncbi:MAG: MBL fold metallo-hydrolase [Alphaproteobacteria bacterium]|nr:MBL fold metallo-hydrolase [Alphaproteobacteria bacterium]
MLTALLLTSFAAHATEVVPVGWRFVGVFALVGDDGVVLVDTHDPGGAARVLERLERRGVDADRITAVLLTHGHQDHAGSAAELTTALGVPLIAGEGDRDMLAAGQCEPVPTGARGRVISRTLTYTFPPTDIDVPVTDTLSLEPWGVAGEARVVGGHTAGSLVITLDDGEVLVGDLVRGHLLRRRAPTLHFFQDDAAVAHAALAELLAAQEVTVVWPSHGGPMRPARVSRWVERRISADQRR